MKRDVLDDAVALVEDAEDRRALGHWGDPALSVCGRRHLRATLSRRVLRRLTALPARGKRQAGEREREFVAHAYSGIHGS
jgi:hypothetical protein